MLLVNSSIRSHTIDSFWCLNSIRGPECKSAITGPICLRSVAVCRFPNTGDDWYVLVGVARDMILNPRSVSGGFIYTYRLAGGGEKLEFVHKVGFALCVLMGS